MSRSENKPRLRCRPGLFVFPSDERMRRERAETLRAEIAEMRAEDDGEGTPAV